MRGLVQHGNWVNNILISFEVLSYNQTINSDLNIFSLLVELRCPNTYVLTQSYWIETQRMQQIVWTTHGTKTSCLSDLLGLNSRGMSRLCLFSPSRGLKQCKSQWNLCRKNARTIYMFDWQMHAKSNHPSAVPRKSDNKNTKLSIVCAPQGWTFSSPNIPKPDFDFQFDRDCHSFLISATAFFAARRLLGSLRTRRPWRFTTKPLPVSRRKGSRLDLV